MARGESKVQNEAQQLMTQQEQQAAAQQAANQQLQGATTPTAEGMLNWGSPQIENDYEQAEMQPVDSAMDTARQRAASRVSRTRNEAGYGAEEENLAGQQAAGEGNAALRGKLAYQNQQLQEQQAGLKSLADLYGVDTSLLSRMLGLPNESLATQEGAAKPTNSFKFGPLGLSF